MNNSHGGKRRRAGRPPIPGRPLIKSVKLSQEDWELAKTIGDGNMAEGIRRALRNFQDPGASDAQ